MHSEATKAPAGKALGEMYATIPDEEGKLLIGKLTDSGTRGRAHWYTVTLFHPDPIAAGQPDAGTMTIEATDLLQDCFRFFPTFAEAVASVGEPTLEC
jgi:hypothetical protein